MRGGRARHESTAAVGRLAHHRQHGGTATIDEIPADDGFDARLADRREHADVAAERVARECDLGRVDRRVREHVIDHRGDIVREKLEVREQALIGVVGERDLEAPRREVLGIRRVLRACELKPGRDDHEREWSASRRRVDRRWQRVARAGAGDRDIARRERARAAPASAASPAVAPSAVVAGASEIGGWLGTFEIPVNA